MSDTERDERLRCTSRQKERNGRTHWCRRKAGHVGPHICICSRRWETREQVKA